jgi:hypoxanthine phosphoribosyltransferase
MGFKRVNNNGVLGGFQMTENIKEILISEEQIQAKVKEFAKQLSEEYADKDPVFVGVLKGVVMFFGDVVKQITVPCQIDFMWLSSYQGTDSKQMVVKRDVSVDIKGRHVVILEDIFDTGNSLEFTYKHLLSKEPASLKICTLLDKPERRNPAVTVKPDYVGFTIPNEFVVGYGLDFNEHFRNLPYVGVLKPEAYQ